MFCVGVTAQILKFEFNDVLRPSYGSQEQLDKLLGVFNIYKLHGLGMSLISDPVNSIIIFSS